MKLKDLKVSQLARAVETITGRPTTAKSFSYKSRAINRVTALMTEHNLSLPEVLQAAGLTMIETPKSVMQSKNTAVQPKRVTKQSILVSMLQSGEGASISALTKATGWLPHTVRGAISNVVRKKLGLNVTTTQAMNGERVYRVID